MEKGKKKTLVQVSAGPFREDINGNLSNAFLFSDTVYTIDSRAKSWNYIYMIFEEEMQETSEDATTIATAYQGGLNSSSATICDIVRSHLHKVAACPHLMPYSNMIFWVMDEVDISKWLFVTRRGITIGSFDTESIHGMYHLSKT